MIKVIPVELAKKLKSIGFHEPCAHCYIWEYSDPVDEEKDKDLPQHFKCGWRLYYNFLLQDWEWKTSSCFEWVKTYYETYHSKYVESCWDNAFFPFVDWNMDILDYWLIPVIIEKKEDIPEIWEAMKETYKTHEWYNNLMKYEDSGSKYLEEIERVTKLLESTPGGWEQGTDWSFDLYLEFISAPTYIEVLEWLNKEKGFNPVFNYSDLEKVVTDYIINKL